MEENERARQWDVKSKLLAKELEQFATDYDCLECSRFYCGHMLSERRKQFRKRLDKNFRSLIELTSP